MSFEKLREDGTREVVPGEMVLVESSLDDVKVLPPSSRDAQEVARQTPYDVLSGSAIKKRIVDKEQRKLSSSNEVSKDRMMMPEQPIDRTATVTCRQCCCRRDIFFVVLLAIFVNALAGALFAGVLFMTLAMGVSALYVYFGLFLFYIFGIITAVNVGKGLKAEAARNADVALLVAAAATVRANRAENDNNNSVAA